MNELECIRAFVKVVEVGSFAEAARQTHTVKSVITKRVNQLEEHLELQLMQRSTRKLTITDGGADFYERAVNILAQLDQAKSAVSSVEWGLNGTLRVSCISSFASRYLGKDLCEFQQEHPELKVELQQDDRFCDPIQEGFDLCLQIDRGANNPSTAIEKVEIFPIRRLIVASPKYIKKYGSPQSIDELLEHRYAHNIYVESGYQLDFLQPEGCKSIKIDPLIRTNTVWMVHAAITSHEYMGYMPAFFIEEELISGKLVPILPNTQTQTPKLAAFYHRSSFVPMKVRIFINFLRRKYGEHPPWEKRILEQRPELADVLGIDSSQS